MIGKLTGKIDSFGEDWVIVDVAGVGEADNAFAALQNFEESVSRDEAAAKAYDSMAGSPDEDLEAEFAALDISSVDDDLAALKQEMGK